MKKKVIIVVPTIREPSIKQFIKRWEKYFHSQNKFDVKLIIIEDNPTKTFTLNSKANIIHYSWIDIDKDCSSKSWIFPRRTDCIRSYGYWKAWQANPDMIITLDDDCYPYKQNQLIEQHWQKLNEGIKLKVDAWVPTVEGMHTRGFPYQEQARKKVVHYKKIYLNHGLWYNIPDFDARTQLSMTKFDGYVGFLKEQIFPSGSYYPMCGMNIAWRPELTPSLYFLLMGENDRGKSWNMHRFGDIWAGIIAKKICDHFNYQVSSGSPVIWHDRASDPYKSIARERRAIKINENFWRYIDSINLTSTSIKDSYLEIANGLKLRGSYWDQLRSAMKDWTTLFQY